jgi:UDP-N-acetylmuramoyl-tripeptide--D-alanyl-D-alanine ligase
MKLGLRDLEKLRPVEIRNAERFTRPLSGVSTDSRSVGEGDLFVALRGQNYDGHRFLGEAAARGALAAMVEAPLPSGGEFTMPLVVVENTTRALGVLARRYRDRFNLPVIAIGGSSGKTTTKEMLAALLAKRYRVLYTEKNYNNQIGVAKTLLRLTKKHEVAVVEIGTNHPGEMETLCDILNPTHGLLTNIGAEHLEFFGSLQGVEQEEGKLFAHLAARNGRAFVNANDRRVERAARPCRRRVTYGFSHRGASVRGRRIRLDSAACPGFEFSGGRVRRHLKVQLKIPGRHQAGNALAAVAVGLAFGLPGRAIVAALEAVTASEKRMAVVHLQGVTILNDTYNANGDSTVAALETLAAMTVTGKRLAVLGDMLELGAHEAEEHRRVGEAARSLKIDVVLTFGPRSRIIHEAVAGGFAVHYEEKNVLAEYLAELVAPGDAVLVKGSRGMAMEDVVTFLGERLQGGVA